MLRALGVKPTKCLPEELIDAAYDGSTPTLAALPENSDASVVG